jgi:hypothetical protein
VSIFTAFILLLHDLQLKIHTYNTAESREAYYDGAVEEIDEQREAEHVLHVFG